MQSHWSPKKTVIENISVQDTNDLYKTPVRSQAAEAKSASAPVKKNSPAELIARFSSVVTANPETSRKNLSAVFQAFGDLKEIAQESLNETAAGLEESDELIAASKRMRAARLG